MSEQEHEDLKKSFEYLKNTPNWDGEVFKNHMLNIKLHPTKEGLDELLNMLESDHSFLSDYSARKEDMKNLNFLHFTYSALIAHGHYDPNWLDPMLDLLNNCIQLHFQR